jgi:hypothetical protein
LPPQVSDQCRSNASGTETRIRTETFVIILEEAGRNYLVKNSGFSQGLGLSFFSIAWAKHVRHVRRKGESNTWPKMPADRKNKAPAT